MKPILSCLLVFALLLAGCAANEPAPVSSSAPVASSVPASSPEPEPLSAFDGYAEAYEQENSIESLAQADDSTQQDFFDTISTEGYDLVLAREDLQTVSDSNKPLLEEFIQWVENLHETCNFDRLVEQFIAENPDVDLSQDPTQLYQYLNEQGMTVDYVLNTACDNEYTQGFIQFIYGGTYSDKPIITVTNPEDMEFERSTPEEMEEIQRQREERRRQEQLEFEKAALEAQKMIDSMTPEELEASLEANNF